VKILVSLNRAEIVLNGGLELMIEGKCKNVWIEF
jgi:hypothetical protein